MNNAIIPTAGSIMAPAANGCWGVRLFSTYRNSDILEAEMSKKAMESEDSIAFRMSDIILVR